MFHSKRSLCSASAWAVLAAATFFGPSPGNAQITLGTAESFGVLAGSTVTNTGTTIIRGHVGVSPGSTVTGFPPGVVLFPSVIHLNDAVAAQAQIDLTTAYDAIEATPTEVDLTGMDLGGLTLTPGVYGFTTTAQLTGTLTLDAEGDPDALFLFKIASALTTASGSSVALINGASACNVYWQIGSSATLGTTSELAGNLLALSSITFTTGSSISGRILARNGAVTLDGNLVVPCEDGGPGGPTPPAVIAIPTLDSWGALLLVALIGMAAVLMLAKR